MQADDYTAQRFVAPPRGFDSTHAVGRSGPPESGDVALFGDGGASAAAAVPTAAKTATLATAKSAVRQTAGEAKSAFSSDEFVVYDEGQVALRYLVRLASP